MTVLCVLLIYILVALAGMRLKVAGSSVLIHLLGSHRMGFRGSSDPAVNRWRSEVAAQVIGVLTLNVPVAVYRAAHARHHDHKTFARASGDPDAELLFDLGFRPGTPYHRLWLRFWWTLISPIFHARLSWARVRGTFGTGPSWRLGVAWTFWTALIAGAWAVGLLLPMLLGFVLPLMFFGNIGAFLELASEHLWMTGHAEGNQRQAELSHGRFLGAMPPTGRSPGAWGRWALSTLGSAAMRFAVIPGDLPHHSSHHLNDKPERGLDHWGWTNAALEYSPGLWRDEVRQRKAVTSLKEAFDRWFVALAAEKAQELKDDPLDLIQ